MVVSATQTWNEEFDFGDGGLPVWEDPDSPQEYTFPFTPGSSSLTITGPGDTVIVMDKISFSILSDLTGSWEKAQELLRSPARVPSRSSAPAEYTMSLSFLGDYGYVWDTQNGLGKWDASGTDSGYLRTVVKVYTGMEEGGPHTVDWGFLNEYTLDNQPSLTVDIDEAGLTKYVHPAD
jgi:hypothetical protein